MAEYNCSIYFIFFVMIFFFSFLILNLDFRKHHPLSKCAFAFRFYTLGPLLKHFADIYFFFNYCGRLKHCPLNFPTKNIFYKAMIVPLRKISPNLGHISMYTRGMFFKFELLTLQFILQKELSKIAFVSC